MGSATKAGASGAGAADAAPPSPAAWLAELAAASAAAAPRIRAHVRRTPLEDSPWLSAAGGCRAWLKLESEQVGGSFKARGAVNKLLSLPPEALAKGLATCSTGNHALAFVHAARAAAAGGARLGPALVYLPRGASAAKVEKLRAAGAALVLHGDDCLDAELEARRVAGERGLVYVSPYNDWEIIAGQGTVAIEILEQLQEEGEDLRLNTCSGGGGGSGGGGPGGAAEAAELVVYIPVGGGGLIGGMAAVLKAALGSRVRVVGCQPAASDVMRQSVAAGRIVAAASGETLSDATAGGIEEGAVTLEPCIAAVDEWVCVSEQEIADAVLSVLTAHSKLIEGAAGCAVAAFWRQRARLAGARAVVLCCGGNVSVEALQAVLARGRVLSPDGGGPADAAG
ncbi:MAG: tryptophan synthase beta subunit-like PLP-dependent enzyme [Monoraphidium minutum]|nr:MAG: tryptophan synthase beta subunit-like PLP-dependent enzyme [Monoraphidium minutum]